MASVEKISKGNVYNLIRHNERLNQNYSNTDIDLSLVGEDYLLSPSRGMSSYDYYKKRLSECYMYNRGDVKPVFSWIVTAPEDVADQDIDVFMENCYEFLVQRYGEENCISCTVHKDESGRPHLHYMGMPVVPDPKHEQGQKICMNDVINRKELRNFHPDLDKFLKSKGMSCGVYTGVTAKQGGNRTVKEMKQERDMQKEIKRENRWSVERERTW